MVYNFQFQRTSVQLPFRWQGTVAVFAVCLSFFACNDDKSAACSCGANVCDLCAGVIDSLETQFHDKFLSDPQGFHQIIEQYHRAMRTDGSAQAVQPGVDLYFDFSGSMSTKIKIAAQNDGILSYLLNVTPDGSTFYRMVEGAPDTLQAPDPKLYVKKADNYSVASNYAQLDEAIQQVISRPDRQSILVTDGELAQRGETAAIRDQAWAKEDFSQWLKQGNRIDFIVKKMEVGGEEDSRLFFILFTPALWSGKDDQRSVVNKFLQSTKNNLRNNEYLHLSFTVEDYHLEKTSDGRPVAENGINSTLVGWVGGAGYTRFEKVGDGFEHLHFEDKKGFSEYIADFAGGKYGQEDFDPKLNERNKLFFDLKLTNESVNYQIANLDVRVKDFTQSLQAYADFLKCRSSRPIREQDEAGAMQTYWCNPWAACKDTAACQFDAGKAQEQEVREIFELHEASTLKPGPQGFNMAEIAIKPAKNFSSDEWWALGMVRVDVYIKDVAYKTHKDFGALKWKTKGEENVGLHESIRLAMQELEPRNKLIYSYYLTFPEQLR